MTVRFTDSDRAAWLKLINEAERLLNPKAIDLGPVKKAEMRCAGKVLPPRYQGVRGNPFGVLRELVVRLGRDDQAARDAVIAQAAACRAELPEGAAYTPGQFGQVTHTLNVDRKDIYG